MKIVISALHFDWKEMDDCLLKARNGLGLDGVEMSWHPSFQHPHCTREDFDHLRRSREDNRFALSAHLWENIADPDVEKTRADLLGWLSLSVKSGVGNLIIHGGSAINQKEGVARVRRALEGVLPDFERAGVVLNVENHYDYHYHNGNELFSQSWEFLELFSLKSPSLKFCFDTGHGNMTKNTPELLESLSPWLNYVHLADNHGVDDNHVGYGEGTVAWKDVLAKLKGMGFDGTFCVEFPVRENRKPFENCVRDIRALWKN